MLWLRDNKYFSFCQWCIFFSDIEQNSVERIQNTWDDIESSMHSSTHQNNHDDQRSSDESGYIEKFKENDQINFRANCKLVLKDE